MLRVCVSFFLNEEGVKKFPFWYNVLSKAVSSKRGFLSLKYDMDLSLQQANLVLDYTDLESQKQWATSEEHKALIGQISKYFIKAPSTTKNEIVDSEETSQATCSITHKM